MAARLSGSTIVYEAYDLNAALTTADGRGLYCGVYIMHHGATIDEFVRRVLAEWPAEEIREGDMFFTNDPWWGALHANDGILAMPIFWDGRAGRLVGDRDARLRRRQPGARQLRDRRRRPLRRGAAVPGDQDGRATSSRARRRARLPAQQPHAGAERAQHARARRGAALDPPARRRADRAATAPRRSPRRRRRSSTTSSGSCAGGCARSPTAAGSRTATTTTTASATLIYPICCRLTKDGERAALRPDRHRARRRPGPINCARPALEGAIMGVILTFLCHDLPWAIGGPAPDRARSRCPTARSSAPRARPR